MNSGGSIRFGAFSLDRARRQLLRGGEGVHLTPKAFDLLAVLVGEAPRVVSKHELHERLWPGTFVADATLVGVVKELRRALADDDRDHPIIRTAHRVGYAFAAPVLDHAPSRRVAHWVAVQGRRFPLQRGENLIGRDPGSAVHLDSASVSRRHARILIDDDRALIEDLGSKNGTSLGGVRVAGAAELADGVHIHIGSVRLLYRASEAGRSTETQSRITDGWRSGDR